MRDYGAAATLFLICALALAFPWLSGRVTVPWDAKAHFQPQFAFLAHALHSGQSPFWTPNVFAGMPQIADPQSLIFAPFFLLAAALVPEPSFILEDAIVFAMLTMGGLALVAYFFDRGWSAAGALVAALAFAFGGSAAWRIQHTGQIMSLAWLPVTLFLLARAFDRRSLAYGALAGAVAALMALGRDQVAYLSLLMLAAYALHRVATDEAPMASALKPLLAGALAGAALVVLPLAFTLELAAHSNRPEIDLAGAHKGSLPPLSFLTLISANMFGTDGPLAAFWGPPVGESDLFLARNMSDVYMGALPIVALVGALTCARFFAARDIRFFAAAAVFFALYALGRYTPAFAVIYHIPGVDLWRRPADATFLFGVALAILGGYGFHCIDSGARIRPALLSGVMSAAFALAVGVAAQRGHLGDSAVALATSALFSALAIALAMSAPRLRGLPLLVAIAALLGADLAVGNGPNESTALPPEQFEVLRATSADPVIAFLKDKLKATAAPDRRDRIELAAIDFHWPNATLVHGLDHDLGYNPIRLKLFEDATGAGDHLALPEQREFSKLYPAYRSTMSDLLGLRYVATGVPIETIDAHYKAGDFTELTQIGKVHIYENPRALPRVLVAPCAQRADFAQLMASGVWPDVDFRETVLLETQPICHSHPDAPSTATARIVAYGNTEIVVETNADESGGYLVLNDVWHPWWFARIDGEEAPVLRANVMFRAVAVPQGRHEVRFEFRPLRGLLKELRGG